MPDDLVYPHEWAREADGSIEYFDLGDIHGGPKCLRCDQYFCIHCEKDLYNQPCIEQDKELFPLPFTKTQMNARLRHLNRLGYAVRGGIIIAKREPVQKCKPDDHKWTPYDRFETGVGPSKRVYKTSQCVVCSETKRG